MIENKEQVNQFSCLSSPRIWLNLIRNLKEKRKKRPGGGGGELTYMENLRESQKKRSKFVDIILHLTSAINLNTFAHVKPELEAII